MGKGALCLKDQHAPAIYHIAPGVSPDTSPVDGAAGVLQREFYVLPVEQVVKPQVVLHTRGTQPLKIFVSIGIKWL